MTDHHGDNTMTTQTNTTPPTEATPEPTERDLTMIGPRAVIALEALEAQARSLRKALKRNRRAQEALAVIACLTS